MVCNPHAVDTGDNVAFGADGNVDMKYLRPVERFFCKLVPHLHAHKNMLLSGFCILGIVGISVSAVALRPAKKLPSMFPDDHALTKLSDIASKKFYRNSEDEKVRLQVVWGFDLNNPIDRGGTDMLSDDNFGNPVFDPHWHSAAGQRQMQTEMLRVCVEAPNYVPTSGEEQARAGLVSKHRNYTSGLDEAEIYCWPQMLKEYLESNGQSFPTDTPAQVLKSGAFDEFKKRRADNAVSPDVRNWLNNDLEWGVSGVKFTDDEQFVKAAWIGFNTTIRWSFDGIPTDETRLWYDAWEGFMADMDVKAFHTQTELWTFMALVEILLNGVLEGVIFSLVFAFVILLISTNNVIITLMSFSAILGIVMTVFLTMVLAGWEVSILESVCLIIIVGMSIDYTVHLMHSYRHATAPTRVAKATIALTEMGVSVVSGAMTTFLAAAPMFSSVFFFFFQFGSFIAMITVLSLFWAIVYLMTLASAFGPETKGDGWLYGDVPMLRNKWKHLRCCRDARVANSVASVPNGAGSDSSEPPPVKSNALEPVLRVPEKAV
jgi:hypothetical protein